jgi:G3E family GTPase
MAVVSNEFGELGIDQALFGQGGDGRYVELEGGCVCCQLSDELLTTLHDLWERHKPDRMIVETSGVALPFETLVTFWREPITQWVGEALAVVVVNAEQLAEGRDVEGTAEQQISSADLLVLNKIDLVTTESIRRVESMLEDMAPGTPIIHSVNGQVDPAILFPPQPTGVGRPNARKEPDIAPHTHESFEAEEIVIESGIAQDQLMTQLQQLTALRVKGIVRTSEGLRLVQGVGPRIQLVAPPSDLPENLIGRIVAIRRV